MVIAGLISSSRRPACEHSFSVPRPQCVERQSVSTHEVEQFGCRQNDIRTAVRLPSGSGYVLGYGGQARTGQITECMGSLVRPS